jgi:hypothetical protein
MSSAIGLYHEVPNPSLTIRHFCTFAVGAEERRRESRDERDDRVRRDDIREERR